MTGPLNMSVRNSTLSVPCSPGLQARLRERDPVAAAVPDGADARELLRARVRVVELGLELLLLARPAEVVLRLLEDEERPLTRLRLVLGAHRGCEEERGGHDQEDDGTYGEDGAHGPNGSRGGCPVRISGSRDPPPEGQTVGRGPPGASSTFGPCSGAEPRGALPGR